MPEPAPLEMPTGDPAAIDELVRNVAGAAFWLATIGDVLSGPAAAAPGWLGADAVAAEAQVVRVAAIARAAAEAILRATGRLSVHGDLLRDTRRAVGALREEQDEDFRAAWQRLSQIDDPQLAVLTGAAAWTGVVADVEAAEATRQQRHARLLEELADDAAATGRALAEASRPVGGTGRPGDGGRVLAYLAGELPGWGEPELRGHGARLARVLDGEVDAADWESRARAATVYARSPAFAEGLLLGLGADGLQTLLLLVGDGAFGDDMDGDASELARLLALTLGTAERSGRESVGAVLTASYVDRDGEGADPDRVALGMAAVLAVRAGSAGPGATTVASWGRQIVAREHAMAGDRAGTRAADRVFPHVADRGLLDRFDPLPLVVDSLARAGDARAAASFLGAPDAWTVLLGRTWDDGAAALGAVAEHAADDPGRGGRAAVRSVLDALGAGLADGDPADWTVDRGTAAALAPVVASALARHVPVVVDVLQVGVDGRLGARGDALRGLGYLTLDRAAAATVEVAVSEWFGARRPTAETVAVPGAYMAAQQYGQRLGHALYGFEQEAQARREAAAWRMTVGLAAQVPKAGPAMALGVIEGYVASLLGLDGSFSVGADRGLRFDGGDAAEVVVAQLPPDRAAELRALTREAEAAFERTVHALGPIVPPGAPPAGSLLDPPETGLTAGGDRALRLWNQLKVLQRATP